MSPRLFGSCAVRLSSRGALVAIVVALVPTAAAAHVKWFEDPSRYPLRTDLILSERTALLIGVSAAAVALFRVMRRLFGDAHWPELKRFSLMAVGAPTLLAVHGAIALVHAAVQPNLFAPNLPLQPDALGLTLAAVQILIAFSFITGIGDWVAAIALILLGPVAFLLFPPMDVLDQVFWFGIAVVVLVIGRFAAVEGGRPRPWFERRSPAWSARAIAALRIFAGVGVLASALSEKIWNPELGAAFLAGRPSFNVMSTYLGLGWFSNDLFVLVAGVTEGVIGILLISGVLTRLVILAMWVPFNLGVPFLPPQELVGHLPIFGIMYYLLVHSAGIAPGEALDRPTPPGSRAAGARQPG